MAGTSTIRANIFRTSSTFLNTLNPHNLITNWRVWRSSSSWLSTCSLDSVSLSSACSKDSSITSSSGFLLPNEPFCCLVRLGNEKRDCLSVSSVGPICSSMCIGWAASKKSSSESRKYCGFLPPSNRFKADKMLDFQALFLPTNSVWPVWSPISVPPGPKLRKLLIVSFRIRILN